MTDTPRDKRYVDKVYSNHGNLDLIDLVDPPRIVLDIGCGAGDNAALLRKRFPEIDIYGITLSEAEQEQAVRHMESCWIADVETDIPDFIRQMSFDAIILSHVLEHLRNPAETVRRLSPLLVDGGKMYVAVPNAVVWSQRLHYALGRFEYTTYGILDETHLRFFTYHTIDRIFGQCNSLDIEQKRASGHLPLGPVRRLFGSTIIDFLDGLAVSSLPNLFGHQIIVTAVKSEAPSS